MVWCAIGATSLAPTIIVSVHDALVGAWMLDPDAAHSELTLAQVTKRHASTTSASASGSGSGSGGSRGGESEEGLACARLLGADATPSACIARVTATVAVYDRIAAQLKGQRMWTAFECLVRAVSARPAAVPHRNAGGKQEMPVMLCLARMEQHGIGFDSSVLSRVEAAFEVRPARVPWPWFGWMSTRRRCWRTGQGGVLGGASTTRSGSPSFGDLASRRVQGSVRRPEAHPASMGDAVCPWPHAHQ